MFMSAQAGPAADGGTPLPRLGVGVALGLPAGVAAVLATWLLGGEPSIGLLLVTVAAVAVGARTAPTTAITAAAVCWACYDGFVVHREGVLGVDTTSLSMVVGGALVAAVARALVLHRPTVRPAYPVLRIPV